MKKILKFLEHNTDLRISKRDLDDLLVDLRDDGFTYTYGLGTDDDYDDCIRIKILKKYKIGDKVMLLNFNYADIESKIQYLVDWVNLTFDNIRIDFDCRLSRSKNGYSVQIGDKEYLHSVKDVPSNPLVELCINIINLDSKF